MIALKYVSPSFSEELFAENGKMVAVVLNFNKAGMTRDAVKSAFAQDYPCYEILVMDDASEDGSEKEMIEAAKDFIAEYGNKAIKVTATVNETNRTTLGQWKEAVKISDGVWFGMFCGDDVSFPERMKTVSEEISRHPGAAGICTNYTVNSAGELAHEPDDEAFDANSLDWENRAGTIYGCTAFWHRKVLSRDLPDGIMDDFVLTWIAAISNAGELVWKMSVPTVAYSASSGVTTSYRQDVDKTSASLLHFWKKYYAAKEHGKRFGRKVWDSIKDFSDRYASDREMAETVKGFWIASLSELGWFDRLKAVWTVCAKERKNDFGGYRRRISRKVLIRFVSRFFGPFSFAPVAFLMYGKKRGNEG